MGILIEKSGLLSTIQDLGRTGYRKLGINPNGVMDRTAVRLINILLGNHDNESVLEMNFPPPRIKFEEPAVFALGGADLSPRLGQDPINNWQIYRAEQSEVLDFAGKIMGNRSYLAVRSGFAVGTWLASRSTNLAAQIGGFRGRALRKGDRIPFKSTLDPTSVPDRIRLARGQIPSYSTTPTVRFTSGADYRNLTALSELKLSSEIYAVTADSNRMGYRLKGAPLHLLTDKETLSSAVDFGAIQLLPDGQLIVLMADHQTTGGYPLIGRVIETDLPLLAQLGAGDAVRFRLISLEEAEDIYLKLERDLSFLKMGVRFTIDAKN